MPYLQLDTPFSCTIDQKRRLAKRMGEIYSDVMSANIRRGREKEVRAELARQLVAACIEIVGLDVTTINVEFTQHSGDEMYHSMYGGLSDDWQAGQADALDGHA
jgi:phenylpyruvate tautomerase PptA (4-oxalocrotonate tautomerase family)